MLAVRTGYTRDLAVEREAVHASQAGRDRLRFPCPGLHETRASVVVSTPLISSCPQLHYAYTRSPRRLLFPGTEHCPCSHSTRFVIAVQLSFTRNRLRRLPAPLASTPSAPAATLRYATQPRPFPASEPASLAQQRSRTQGSAPVQPASTSRQPRSLPTFLDAHHLTRTLTRSIMVAQRRYSVTGQTPPDDAEAMKAENRSPKLQALDTSVPSTSCGLCESGADASKITTTASNDGGAEQVRGRRMAHAGTVVRTSSKRSATQLPSPSSPSHELPPKIARYRLEHNEDVDTDLDTDTDSDATDFFRDRADREEDDLALHSQATSMPSSPEHSQPQSLCGLPDAASLQKLHLCARDGSEDDCMEDLALSPSHSRNHSLDCSFLDQKTTLQEDWAAFQKSSWVPAPEILHLENVDIPQPDEAHVPVTLLTLPPEIRHQIYRNCEELVFKQPLLYCIATAFNRIQHPLASVSRQVRSEALAIFYSYNTWIVKVEFRMMYEGFQHWIIRLGEGAGSLRLVDLSVRGTLFKPKRTHVQSVLVHGVLVQITPGVAAHGRDELYSPPDGDASFKIDLSEKHIGGKVQLVRNDGTKEAGEKGREYLAKMVVGLWEKRRAGTLNGQDWVTMVDDFITFIGGWVSVDMNLS
jgi:hypothetical protein